MALSPKDALEAVKTVLESHRLEEASRLQGIADALDTSADRSILLPVAIPDDAPKLMRELAGTAETNLLPLLVKTYSQVMKVDGYQTVETEGLTEPWVWWQRNRMDSRQTGITRSALSYGTAYATCLLGKWGRKQEVGPLVKGYSPRLMTALYQDPEADEWPMLAVAIEDQDLKNGKVRQIVSLFDEEMRYTFGLNLEMPAPFLQPLTVPYNGGNLAFIAAEPHGAPGFTPVVRYRDRNLLAGEETMGIVEPLLRVQERINETTFEMLVAQYFQAFKQRYVLGWVPKTEQERLLAGGARIWYLDEDPNDVKIGELTAGDITPYIKSREAAYRDFSAIGQLPPHSMGIDGISNISDATLAGLEAAKNREGGEIMTSIGESHEQLLRLMALYDGNEPAADDYSSEIRWRNFEVRSFAQAADGLAKLASGLGLPAEALLEDVPGFTGQRLERVRELLQAAVDRTEQDAPPAQ